MIIVKTKQFSKKAAKLPARIKFSLAERLKIFIKNPFHGLLNNHSLQGNMRSYRSINITGDYRLIYEQRDDNIACLIDIDTHHNLYGN